MSARAAASIIVLVGTDHHPFARLIDWADGWAGANPQDTVTVQYGHSAAPAVAAGSSFFSPGLLDGLMGTSDIVIMHGGPASISEARAAGHLPLVLPRDPQFGEHVDDHQQRFARWSDHKLLVTAVDSISDLNTRVRALVEDEVGTRISAAQGSAEVDDAARQLPEFLAKTRGTAERSSPGAPVVVHISGLRASAIEPQISALSSADGVTVLGEIDALWEHGIGADSPCSCGLPFSNCDFWIQTGKAAFGGWDTVDIGKLAHLRKSIRSAGNPALSSLPFQTRAMRRQLADHAYYYQAIYEAARNISGARALVCFDRDPALAIALSHNREIDVRLLCVTGKDRGPRMGSGSHKIRGRGWLDSLADAQAARMRHVPRGSVAYADFMKGGTTAGNMRGQMNLPDLWTATSVPKTQHFMLNRGES
ncbi:glycosyltransferase [Arthrobacter sp. H14-L1]|uniref:glycosyltransferase n=1 Tax=Arthrobacter sp. H14-L1 TaxID=2996697 RepID=UPI00226DD70B|nr:glycosyltransferase [Arthrobacter sp. H14-L1]MCY0905710.1 glycosyltransferase [Arthrobacter sp. H14-L1]